MAAKYDTIGKGYSTHRQTDPAIYKAIRRQLGECKTVLNVGAGTGSYEPEDCNVVAIEPSMEMISQRSQGAAPAIKGVAEDIPFADKQFDAAMAILTIHHWPDVMKGLTEVLRVTKHRIVLLTFDPEFSGFWLEDYFPELFKIDGDCFPSMDGLRGLAKDVKVQSLPIPHDCVDGFLCAYWRRPEAYLDPQVRDGISTFSLINQVELKTERLARDLESGKWAQDNKDLLGQTEMDLGYRLVAVTLNE